MSRNIGTLVTEGDEVHLVKATAVRILIMLIDFGNDA